MRGTYVPLSFVLCVVVTVGCWPLHPLEPSTDKLYVPVSSFKSPSESNMGGFLSRARHQEVKEETSPRLESEAEVKPDRNQIEVDRHKKQIAESQSSANEITIGVDSIEHGESPECVDLVRNSSDELPVDDISLTVDADPELKPYPASEEEVVDVNIEEQDNNRQTTDMGSPPFHPDVIQEQLSNENDNVVNVDVSYEQPHPDTSFHNVDEITESSLRKIDGLVLPHTLCKEEEAEIKVEEPDYDRAARSPQIPPFMMIPEQILLDDDADVIVDVSSEEFRPAFDPSIHFMAEPVIFHPQPLPVEDVIDLDIDDELVKRKKRTFQNPNNVHPESNESQPGPDDE